MSVGIQLDFDNHSTTNTFLHHFSTTVTTNAGKAYNMGCCNNVKVESTWYNVFSFSFREILLIEILRIINRLKSTNPRDIYDFLGFKHLFSKV